jgi:hypothetical protein
MVDDVFRSYRNHDGVACDGSETSRGGIGDLLAELARLTGQGDAYRNGGRDDRSSQDKEDDTSSEQHQRGEDHYVAHRRRESSPVSHEHGKQKKPPSNRHSSRPEVKFNGFPGDASDHPAAVNKLQHSDAGHQTSSGKDRQPVLSRPRASTFFPTASFDRHDGEMRPAETDEIHVALSFYDARPSPRWRRVMVIAMLGLAWLGVASAFSYFAVFGGVLPTLPPLVPADRGPKEIVPNYGSARTNNSSQTSMVSAGSSEEFVSRWPADNQEPMKTALISSDPSILRPAVPISRAASGPPPGVTPQAVAASSVPALRSSEPKKVRTILIRPDWSEQTGTSAPAVAHSPTSVRAPGTR